MVGCLASKDSTILYVSQASYRTVLDKMVDDILVQPGCSLQDLESYDQLLIMEPVTLRERG